jgi:hypothetical protein
MPSLAAVEILIPPARENYPLGCHPPRVSDRLCVWGILVRLVIGCSWVSVEAIFAHKVSDATLGTLGNSPITKFKLDQSQSLNWSNASNATTPATTPVQSNSGCTDLQDLAGDLDPSGLDGSVGALRVSREKQIS